jgi:nucleoside-diphosphate-sugar epimerase
MVPVRRQKPLILVTGASGFIGSALIRRLAKDFDLLALDREAPRRAFVEAEFIPLDVESDDAFEPAMDPVRRAHGEHIASVVHLAAYYDFTGEPSPKHDSVTVRGTERLLEVLETFKVDQFVFSSTMLVHRPCEPGERIDEDWPLEPKWDYPKSKVAAEERIRARKAKLPAVVLRLAGVYSDRCDSIPIAHQIQRIYERTVTSRVFPGRVARGQAFLQLADAIEAFRLAIERRADLPSDRTILVGEPETYGYGDVQDRLGHLIHGEHRATQEIPKPVAKIGAWVQDWIPGQEPFIKPWMIDLADDHYALDVGRARSDLGWEAKRRLIDTLPKMIQALEADPAAWHRTHKIEPPASVSSEENAPGGAPPK